MRPKEPSQSMHRNRLINLLMALTVALANCYSTSANNIFENSATFNNSAGNFDLIIKGDTDEELFFTDAGNDRIGISTSSPDALLDIEAAEDTELIRLTDSTNTDSIGFYTGSGTPEGNVAAGLGSMYFDHGAGTVYVKQAGEGLSSGWGNFLLSEGCNWVGTLCSCDADPNGSTEGSITIGATCVNGVLTNIAVVDVIMTSGAGACRSPADAIITASCDIYNTDGTSGGGTVAGTQGFIFDGGNETGATVVVGTTDNFDFQLETNDTTRMHFESSGNIGIGSTSPDALLDIEAAENTELIRFTDSTNTDSAGIYIGSGTPESVVSAELGSLYIDHANGALYIKDTEPTASTGWIEAGTGGGGGGFATTALDNLASVAINTSLLPGSDDSIDIGSSTLRWRDLFLGPTSLHIGNDGDEAVISFDTTNDRISFDQPLNITRAENTEVLRFTDSDNSDSFGIYIGSGTPESSVTSQLGSLYIDHQTGDLYKKTSGDDTNTGWNNVTRDFETRLLESKTLTLNSAAAQNTSIITAGTITATKVELPSFSPKVTIDVTSSTLFRGGSSQTINASLAAIPDSNVNISLSGTTITFQKINTTGINALDQVIDIELYGQDP